MNQRVIEATALIKQFDQQLVLQGVDLAISPGQVVGLVGVNGSGKTTLIKCLLGLLRATGGTARVLGEDSWNLSANAKARLGYVSQEFEMLPWMTVQGTCDYTGSFYATWDTEHVNQLIDQWDVPRKSQVGTLSVGQRQKLAVILALGHRPELLILDEPVASLDPHARRQFLQTLLEFATQDAHTVLFSTHITSDLERVASHVAMMRRGRIGYFDELDTLKENCKRLRIDAAEPLPPDFEVPDSLHCEVDGNHALVTVSQLNEEVLTDLAQRWQAEVRIEDLNLEEIFLEMSRGDYPEGARQ